MSYEIKEPIAALMWPALLACKEYVTSEPQPHVAGIWLCGSEGGWRFTPEWDGSGSRTVSVFARLGSKELTPAHASHEFCLDRFAAGAEPLRSCGGRTLRPLDETILRIYLPLILGGWRARRAGKSFVTAHVAQTLDGRIACNNGHSQWIGNEANLSHAHRLRALHDAVLVGGRTVQLDDPRLDVRLVEGQDPARVVLSGSAQVLTFANERKIFDTPGCTVVCRAEALASIETTEFHRHIKLCPLPSEIRTSLTADAILAALAERGLHSVFVEGGSTTLSGFLELDCIDVLHVHVAPMILGSGIPSFVLPEVTHIRNSRQLRMQHFEMDDELLFECRPNVNPSTEP